MVPFIIIYQFYKGNDSVLGSLSVVCSFGDGKLFRYSYRESKALKVTAHRSKQTFSNVPYRHYC